MNSELTQPNDTGETSSALWGTLAALLVWAAFAIGIPYFFLQPSPPIPATEKNAFSAERAYEILDTLVGDGIPHPAGSEQNDIVRERIVTMLTGFGYEIEIHNTSNNQWRRSDKPEFPLENILARLPGKTNGKAVLLASHYDSVPQGPGASDDGVGTAALIEIARMLKNEGPFEHDIMFLISDGEEYGLLGADKFVAEHPWAKEVECVINLEARGTTGPSFMFETSEHSRWLIPVFSQSVRRPMTSSLFYEIYKLLPNDTDFTMFKRGGMQGFNFAFIGEVNNYHTENDNLESVDLRSLQHHGENMLGLVRTLGDIDFDSQPKGRVVYFDLLGKQILWWPATWSMAIAILGLLLVAGTSWFSRSDEIKPQRHKLLSVGGGVAFALAIVISMALTGTLTAKAMAFDGAFDRPWPEFPWTVPFAFFSIALTIMGALSWLARPFVSTWATWAGTWLLWACLAVVVAWQVDGASYLFSLPLLVAGGTGAICCRLSKPFWASAIAAIGCGFLWLPLEALFFDALGLTPLGINLIVARSTLVCLTLLPAIMSCNRKQLATLTAILGVVSLAVMLGSFWVL